MENATKALLIAAGVLFAVIIVSVAVAAYGRISDYQQSKQNNLSQEQLAAFNNQYAPYDRKEATGFELVSLINKISDYNETNLDEGYERMSVVVKTFNSSSYNGKLFKKNTEYTFDGKNASRNGIERMRNLEKKYSANVLTRLASNRTYIQQLGGDGSKTVQEVLGNAANISGLTGENILEYEDYLTFKRATFTCKKIGNRESVVYKNGQIVGLTFVQTK